MLSDIRRAQRCTALRAAAAAAAGATGRPSDQSAVVSEITVSPFEYR